MTTKIEDYTLVRQTLKGDQDAFAILLGRYKNLVYSIILRMVNQTEEANDLAQEVFIKIYQNLEKYQPEYKFSTWVIRIATNHVIDYRRKKKQDTVNIEDMAAEPSSGLTPEGEYLAKEKSKIIQECLLSLPDMYKIPLLLYHKQFLSYQEISDILGEPLSKIKNRIFRGRKMLAEKLVQQRKEGKGYEL